jgi:predicted metal-dependent hydrolase
MCAPERARAGQSIMTLQHDFEFEVKRSRRRRTLCLQIRDGRVRVMVPARTSERQIRELVHKHGDWVRRKLRQLAARPKAVAKAFVTGERFRYLGRDYPLRIIDGAPWPAELRAGEIVVTVPERIPAAARAAVVAGRLQEWYSLNALEIFQDRAAHFSEILGLAAKSVRVKSYKRRWGGCSARGELSFNWRLIMAPKRVVDYVAAHEVSHLAHHNHSAEFWAVVAGLLPDYRAQQAWLNQNGGTLDF